ncbi:hypothetical protein [Vibrio crassostreae]|uniref:hypothetical protein n=1 Tax=Vibrio crassostreae TaxID=246167 RepID=UPI001B304DEB|nr:hypothetical protein [Vibrio crassostreae]
MTNDLTTTSGVLLALFGMLTGCLAAYLHQRTKVNAKFAEEREHFADTLRQHTEKRLKDEQAKFDFLSENFKLHIEQQAEMKEKLDSIFHAKELDSWRVKQQETSKRSKIEILVDDCLVLLGKVLHEETEAWETRTKGLLDTQLRTKIQAYQRMHVTELDGDLDKLVSIIEEYDEVCLQIQATDKKGVNQASYLSEPSPTNGFVPQPMIDVRKDIHKELMVALGAFIRRLTEVYRAMNDDAKDKRCNTDS